MIKHVPDNLCNKQQYNSSADKNIVKFNLLSCGNKNTDIVGNQVLQHQRYRVRTGYMSPRSHSRGDTPKFTQQGSHTQVHTARAKIKLELLGVQTSSLKKQPTPRIYIAIKLTKQVLLLKILNIATSGNTPHKLLRKPTKQVRRESKSKYSNIENGTTQ